MDDIMQMIEHQPTNDLQLTVYKVVETKEFSLDLNGNLIYGGLAFEPYFTYGHDPLTQAFDDLGTYLLEAGVEFPEDISLGNLYRAEVGNVYTDWETGIVDDWDVVLHRITEGDIKELVKRGIHNNEAHDDFCKHGCPYFTGQTDMYEDLVLTHCTHPCNPSDREGNTTINLCPWMV